MISTMTITETRKKITSLENTMNYDDTISITNEKISKNQFITAMTVNKICPGKRFRIRNNT